MNEEISQETKTANSNETDKPWLFKKGQSGNPSGRPKGTLKDYVRRKFMEMSDKEKADWIEENHISGIDQWKMSEGNPKNDVEIKGNLNISEVLNELDGSKTREQTVADQPLIQDQKQDGETDPVQTEPSAS